MNLWEHHFPNPDTYVIDAKVSLKEVILHKET